MRNKASGWTWAVGHWNKSFIVYPTTVATIFAILIVASLISGIVLTVRGVYASNLGDPLIVGALFAAGAFVSQFWVVSYRRYQEVRDYVHGDELDHPKKIYEELETICRLIKERESHGDGIDQPSKKAELDFFGTLLRA